LTLIAATTVTGDLCMYVCVQPETIAKTNYKSWIVSFVEVYNFI